jgi:integrase/recombinase XerD
VELASMTPGMVGQYLVGLGGLPAKRNQHLAALRGFFDRVVNRHVCILNPAASVKGVKDQVIESKTPEITIEHARTLLASIKLSRKVKNRQGELVEVPLVVGLRDRAILATLAYTARRAGAVAKLRLGDFQHDGQQYTLRFQKKGGNRRETPVRHDLDGFILAYVDAAGLPGGAKESPLFRASNGRSRTLAARPLGTGADLRAGEATAERRRAAVAFRTIRWSPDAEPPLRLSQQSGRLK